MRRCRIKHTHLCSSAAPSKDVNDATLAMLTTTARHFDDDLTTCCNQRSYVQSRL